MQLLDQKYLEYDNQLVESHTEVPNVQGMSGMDALSLLENIGLKVQISGIGKVASQSLKQGEKLVKGATIILKLS